MTNLSDPRPMLARALDQVGALISTTDPAQAQLPTPCAEYDVAALIGHLQGVVRRIGAVVSGQPFFSVPVDNVSVDWAGEWAEGRTGTDAALAAADLSQLVRVPWGEVPVGAAIGSYVGELATHAWDLAAATGRTDELDPELAEAALPMAHEKIPAHIRGQEGIPFAAVVEVPDDAPAYDRLAGWHGRDPRWAPVAV